MDDILLTQEERDTMYTTDEGEFGTDMDKWEETICRAQVRKVVEWLEKHSYWEDKIHLIVSRDTVQFLRAAAEEVKPLPTIDEYIGSDPDFTGGMSTKEYIEDMRGTEPEEARQ
jgi:hypothetical protein